jgi:Zn-dependent metalloprotease
MNAGLATARHSILPPHVLRSIAENGTSEQRSVARRSLTLDRRLRTRRSALRTARRRTPAVLEAIAARGTKERTICSAEHEQSLPGSVVRREGDPPARDAAADEAYDYLGATYDFYWTAYARHSIDDAGLALLASVHFGTAYDNAFWNGEQMVFGDGDDDLFRRFTVCVDVVGHELTHGVTEHDARLQYAQQAGALNESVSDVFGSLIKQWTLKQTAEQADWLIGAGLFTSRVHGQALRSMKAPGTAYDDPVLGKDPQPDHWSGFVRTSEDNGGVHINSGIPNRAFYLAAVGIGGSAWEKAGRIWYETLRDSRLRPASGFKAFASRTVANAARLYGARGSEQKAVREAWRQVGLPVAG